MRTLYYLLLITSLLSFNCLADLQNSAPATMAQTENEVVFYISRHGKTMFNTVHRAQGWSDTPLTTEGIKVAEQLGKGLRDIDFVAVYSSDLGRARQTAKIILAEKHDAQNIIESEALRESCFGIFEGDLDPNMWTPAAKYLGYTDDSALFADMGSGKVSIKRALDAIAAVDTSGLAENYATVQTRFMAKLHEIAEQAAAKGGGNILLISHGVALMVVINSVQDKKVYNHLLKNASITKIIYRNGQFDLIGEPGDMSFVEQGAKLAN